MSAHAESLSVITHKATQVLCREIGVVNTIRFINQYTTGSGDYTKEREQMIGDLSLDEITSAIRENCRGNGQ